MDRESQGADWKPKRLLVRNGDIIPDGYELLVGEDVSGENQVVEFPNLNKFIEAKTDEERLALGVEVLQAAWKEAKNLPGWQVDVYEYLYAITSGKGLNRPV